MTSHDINFSLQQIPSPLYRKEDKKDTLKILFLCSSGDLCHKARLLGKDINFKRFLSSHFFNSPKCQSRDHCPCTEPGGGGSFIEPHLFWSLWNICFVFLLQQ